MVTESTLVVIDRQYQLAFDLAFKAETSKDMEWAMNCRRMAWQLADLIFSSIRGDISAPWNLLLEAGEPLRNNASHLAA